MITTLTGKNTFLLAQEKRVIVNAQLSAHGDLSIEEIDCEDIEPQVVYDAITNLPFLVEKKLVVLESPSSNKPLTEKLPEWLKDSDSIDILIVERTPDKRTVWYKFLQSSTKLIELQPADEMGLKRWASEYVNEQGGLIEPAALTLLISRTGLNQQQVYQELRKLLAHNPKITSTDVDELVESLPQDTIFDMLDALANGNVRKSQELYESLKLRKVDPMEVLSLIGWQLHTLSLIKAARGGPSGLHPYVVRKNQALTNRLTMTQLKVLVDNTYKTELRVKRDGVDSDQAVTVLLLGLAESFNQ